MLADIGTTAWAVQIMDNCSVCIATRRQEHELFTAVLANDVTGMHEHEAVRNIVLRLADSAVEWSVCENIVDALRETNDGA